MNFFDSWKYLYNHKMYKNQNGDSCFSKSLIFKVVKVNPETNETEDEKKLNTKTKIRIKTGNWDIDIDDFLHDFELDCYGDTYEEAIINLAKLVKEKDCLSYVINAENFFQDLSLIDPSKEKYSATLLPSNEVLTNISYEDITKIATHILSGKVRKVYLEKTD